MQSAGKDMVKVTDENLLNKTGGIVRGMSGSSIVQNGKLVGAVTHVFVNDPTATIQNRMRNKDNFLATT